MLSATHDIWPHGFVDDKPPPSPNNDPTGGLARLGLKPGNPRLFDALINHAPTGVFVTDHRGACLYANSSLCDLTGLGLEQQLDFGWREALHPDDAERVARAWEEAIRDVTDLSHDQRFIRPDGSIAWVEMKAVPIRDGHGDLAGWAGACVDVTRRKLSEDRFQDFIEHARDAIYVADLSGNLLSVNHAAEGLTGYSRDELLGMNFLSLIAPDDLGAGRAAMERSLSGVDEARITLRLVAKDGHHVYTDVTGRVVQKDGRPIHFEGIARDVTKQHELQEQLAHQAFHDPLTGLPNRVLFFDRLSQALARADRVHAPVAVILLDLDDFKLVNDSLGHRAGDELLRAVAPRLVQAVREGDTVARLGGDEFAFVIEALGEERDALPAAERIVSALAAPFTVGDNSQQITASLGIAFVHRGDDPETVLRNADTAMYSAKANNQGSFEVFDDAMRQLLLREIAIKDALGVALERGQLEVHYQPIVSLDDRRMLGLEALVRWRHPERGWVRPSEFIPVAEGNGLIVPLGRFVVAEAARQAARWHDRHRDGLPLGVFVNVSPQELDMPDYSAFVEATLSEVGLPPAALGLEITERSFLEVRGTHAAANLGSLTALGVHLSLDDFGTGYSSLATLKRLPFTAIKIDRYFIQAIRQPTDPAPISTAIVGLGKALAATVIAEGVETEARPTTSAVSAALRHRATSTHVLGPPTRSPFCYLPRRALARRLDSRPHAGGGSRQGKTSATGGGEYGRRFFEETLA